VSYTQRCGYPTTVRLVVLGTDVKLKADIQIYQFSRSYGAMVLQKTRAGIVSPHMLSLAADTDL
jgi:hypothetical protein